MSRFYTESPLSQGTTYSSASSHIRQLDLARINSDSNSIFLLTLAASNLSLSATSNTPTPLSSFHYPFPAVPLNDSAYSLFANLEETPFLGAPIWPAGLEYGNEDDYGHHNSSSSTNRSSVRSGSYHGQAVEIHRGTAKGKAWFKKTFTKIIPKRRKRLGEGRMLLD
ncbi:hypothetical protein FRC04_000821 [Tulasnella sp. 424]|nr:hypothetical protein FRC04_000821 [Tulasnella sp. 424]KAG8963251.1 hypothetical protein FRC05_004814 [Tulasnella sp. 425]